MIRIQFFTEDIKFRVKNTLQLRRWICIAIKMERKKVEKINIILCSDTFLFELNKKYLKRKSLTDILTFSFSEIDDFISGDMYISVERVRVNGILFKQKLEMELRRVIIHGILHLVGFNDKGGDDKKKMRAKENIYLNLYDELFPTKTI
ncbi:MAG: rRNA maturation RNase YbeY [Bacteroidetes bacterium]|nr:rRNA maturation RNase YbeY [Bacteroidota bacterium]